MVLGKWPNGLSFIAVLSIGTGLTLPALAKPNPREGEAIAATCNTCHGSNGISVASSIPNLAGQHYPYLFNQLNAFKNGTRKSSIMNGIARNLSKKQMQDLAAYYASIPITVGKK